MLYALWNLSVGLPAFFDLGPGVDVFTAGSGGLGVLIGLTIMLDINQSAIAFATEFERLHAMAQGRPSRGTPTRLRARGEGAFLALTALLAPIIGIHALT